jgi:hypothetical protein
MPKPLSLASPRTREHLARFAQGMALEATAAELALLARFVRGELTIEQVEARLTK